MLCSLDLLLTSLALVVSSVYRSIVLKHPCQRVYSRIECEVFNVCRHWLQTSENLLYKTESSPYETSNNRLHETKNSFCQAIRRSLQILFFRWSSKLILFFRKKLPQSAAPSKNSDPMLEVYRTIAGIKNKKPPQDPPEEPEKCTICLYPLYGTRESTMCTELNSGYHSP